MKDSLIISKAGSPSFSEVFSFTDRIARSLVLKSLENITIGSVKLIESGKTYAFGCGSDGMHQASIQVHSPKSYRAIAFGGTVGAGRAFIEGLWSTDDLASLVRIFIINSKAHFGLEGGVAKCSRFLNLINHWLRRNNRSGSRTNISEHYDLGNEFYRLFLDDTLTYSCGWFEHSGASMREASLAKYDRLCRKLDLTDQDHLLEIGSGWGGFAIYAANQYGCRVTTTTISAEQYKWVCSQVDRAGLTDQVTVLNNDYRDLTGVYDKLVSIEMLEGVGHQYYGKFFECCSNLLKSNGIMALQVITVGDQMYKRHIHEVDFIKRYIFPGSNIPSVAVLMSAMAEGGDFRLFHMEDITHHYVTTLQNWRQKFLSGLDEVKELGFDQNFIRMWEFYLSYCEGGFSERYLGNIQMVLVKPSWRGAKV